MGIAETYGIANGESGPKARETRSGLAICLAVNCSLEHQGVVQTPDPFSAGALDSFSVPDFGKVLA